MPTNTLKDDIKRYLKKIIGQQRATSTKQKMQHLIFSAKNFKHQMPLDDIGRHFATDKADPHHCFNGLSYLNVYEKYFRQKKHLCLNILEIGVRNAASLRMWKAYFPQGHIWGIDIDPECKKYEETRISIEIGSQDDTGFLSRAFGQDKQFDVIIDDGSHINRQIIHSFDYLFYNRLKPGGIYIIEDLGCSYEQLQNKYDIISNWPGMKYNEADQNFDNDRQEMNLFFEKKLYDLDHKKGEILSIHFWSMICIILKSHIDPECQ